MISNYYGYSVDFAQFIALEERHRVMMAMAEQDRLIRESKLAGAVEDGAFKTLRRRFGAVLIRLGRQLHGIDAGSTDITPAFSR